MQAFDDILDMDIRKLSTLLSLGSVFNTLYSLEDEGVDTSFLNLFIPAVATHFGAGLAANSIYKQFSLSPEGLFIFFLGMFLFTLTHRIVFLRHLAKICPLVGKSMFFVALKNSETPIYLILGWLLICEVTGRIIRKILLNKEKIEISQDELTRMFVLNLSLIMARRMNLPDISLSAFVFFVSYGPIINEYLKERGEEAIDINHLKKKSFISNRKNK